MFITCSTDIQSRLYQSRDCPKNFAFEISHETLVVFIFFILPGHTIIKVHEHSPFKVFNGGNKFISGVVRTRLKSYCSLHFLTLAEIVKSRLIRSLHNNGCHLKSDKSFSSQRNYSRIPDLNGINSYQIQLFSKWFCSNVVESHGNPFARTAHARIQVLFSGLICTSRRMSNESAHYALKVDLDLS